MKVPHSLARYLHKHYELHLRQYFNYNQYPHIGITEDILKIIYCETKINIVGIHIQDNGDDMTVTITLYCGSKESVLPPTYIKLRKLQSRSIIFKYMHKTTRWQRIYDKLFVDNPVGVT
jgi:hypothetical protein